MPELGFANSFDWKHDVWQTERTFLALHNITCKIPSQSGKSKTLWQKRNLKKSDLRGIYATMYCRSYCDRAKPGLSQKSTWKLLCLWWLMSHPITSAMSTFNAFVLLAASMIYARETSFISWSSSSRKLLYEEFWSYDAANEASFYIFFFLVLTILTSSMLEKLRTKMLTWTRVAESVRKKTSLQAFIRE